jgi:hypothetical protein
MHGMNSEQRDTSVRVIHASELRLMVFTQNTRAVSINFPNRLGRIAEHTAPPDYQTFTRRHGQSNSRACLNAIDLGAQVVTSDVTDDLSLIRCK